eukprot:14677041-Alexandrium_andersonii.AAC.1
MATSRATRAVPTPSNKDKRTTRQALSSSGGGGEGIPNTAGPRVDNEFEPGAVVRPTEGFHLEPHT